MNIIDIPLNLNHFDKHSKELEILHNAEQARTSARELAAEERYMDALERVVSGLRTLRDFSDFENKEFRAILVGLLFDLATIHFELKDYKQSEKELEILFRLLDTLIKEDAERFGKYHILAMELSTRILRSRKKALELLVKQQINAGALYEKVNAGVVAATDKLVDSLRNVGQLLASAGDYRASMKFYAEAIKFSKKRMGRVTRKEIKMTIEMAEIMMRVRSMRPRARRLLNAILPHAIAFETIELENEILALIEIIDADIEHEPKWKAFFHKIAAARASKKEKKKDSPDKKEEEKKDSGKDKKKSSRKGARIPKKTPERKRRNNT